MGGWISTVFGVLESSLQYEHFGIMKRQIGVEFEKNRGSKVAILVRKLLFWIRIELVVNGGGFRVEIG